MRAELVKIYLSYLGSPSSIRLYLHLGLCDPWQLHLQLLQSCQVPHVLAALVLPSLFLLEFLLIQHSISDLSKSPFLCLFWEYQANHGPHSCSMFAFVTVAN